MPPESVQCTERLLLVRIAESCQNLVSVASLLCREHPSCSISRNGVWRASGLDSHFVRLRYDVRAARGCSACVRNARPQVVLRCLSDREDGEDGLVACSTESGAILRHGDVPCHDPPHVSDRGPPQRSATGDFGRSMRPLHVKMAHPGLYTSILTSFIVYHAREAA